MIRKLVALIAFALAAATPHQGSALDGDCSDIAKPRDVGTLRIGVSLSTPFVMGNIFRSGDGSPMPEGLGIEMWDLIETCLLIKQKPEFVPFENLNDLLEATQANQVDLALSAIPINVATEARVDLSVPIHQGALAVLVPDRDNAANMRLVLSKLYQSNIMTIIAGLAGFVLMVSIWQWMVERRRGNKFFSEGPLWGLYRSIIWTALLIFRGKGDPFELKSQFGQLFVVAVMLVGVTIVSGLTAIITSNLTLQGLEPEITTTADLDGKIIAVKSDTRAAQWAKAQNLTVRELRTYSQVMLYLDEAEIDAFINDEEELRYLNAIQTLRGTQFSPLRISPQNYAIAFPAGSPLRKYVNLAILDLHAARAWTETVKQYLGRR